MSAYSPRSVWAFIVRTRLRRSISVGGLLLILSLWSLKNIGFSYHFDDFFPKDDEDLEFYYQYRDQLAADDNFLLIGLSTPSALDPEFLHALDTASTLLAKSAQTQRVASLTTYRYLWGNSMGMFPVPLVHPDDPERRMDDSVRIVSDPLVCGKLVSADMQTVVIATTTPDSMDLADNQALLADVEEAMTVAGFDDYHLLGKANFESELIRFQQEEFIRFSILSVLCVALISFLLFRDLRVVGLSMLTVTVTLVFFLGLLGLTHRTLNVMSSLYPIIIIIVGISDMVHFVTRYQTEREAGFHPRRALGRMLQDVGFATFLTSVTTAIGFLTLLSSPIPPIREFGILAAAGVLLAYLVTLLFAAPMMMLLPLPQKAEQGRSYFIARITNRIYRSGKKRPVLTAGVSLLVVLLGILGASRMTTDITLADGLPKHTAVYDDFLFFEEQFNGFRPFELAAIAGKGFEITDTVVLQQIDLVENYIASFPEAGNLFSVTAFYKVLNRALDGDNPAAYRLPDNAPRWNRVQSLLGRYAGPDMQLYSSADGSMGRLSGSFRDAGTDQIGGIQDSIKQFIARSTDSNQVTFRLTGTGLMFDKNNEYIRRSILSGIVIALSVISLLMALLYRNFRMLVIAVVPNTIPLLICGGILGFFRIPLDAPTAIIFGISYGIVVDDTIHFLSRFRLEIARGVPLEEAIRRTFSETGRALIMTTLILFFGFSVLMLSNLQATFNVGMLIGITLLSALISDLYLLPLLLRKWYRP
ncbi:MAG TPA: MMPL family transporter [Chitinophagales bacterium]|nr:MMPL family transporter [Chitinophagales bacterium]HRX22632.1 MMPL family transporter [Chitinophagales bacterium]